MPHHHLHIDGPRRPPPLPVLTRREIHLRHYRSRESAHADWCARADLLVAVDDEIDARSMFRTDAHRACGLASNALDDGSLTTAQLRAALDLLRGLPTP